jgi:hypothetical protein
MAIVLLYALLAAAQPVPAHSWNVYENARFGTLLSYPGDLFRTRTESDNGDGITLRAADGATLAIFGSNNAEHASPAAYVQGLTGSNARYRQLSYRVVRANFAVLSGTIGNRLFYERYAFDPAGRVHGFVLEYPAAARARYDPIVPHLSASLSWRHGRRQI